MQLPYCCFTLYRRIA